jgi:hypothetical protein
MLDGRRVPANTPDSLWKDPGFRRLLYKNRRAEALQRLGGKCCVCGSTRTHRIWIDPRDRPLQLDKCSEEKFDASLSRAKLYCAKHIPKPKGDGGHPVVWARLEPVQGCHPIVRGLLRIMRREACNFLRMARRSGVNRETLGRWNSTKRGNMPLVDNLEAALGVFGLCLIAVPRDWVEDREPKRGRPLGDRVIDTRVKLRRILERSEASGDGEFEMGGLGE